MSEKQREEAVARCLNTPEGKEQLRQAIQEAAAKAADHLPEGSLGEALARQLARLPPKKGKP